MVIGPGNAIITVGDNIVSLSQPPARGEGGLQVPVDFLRKTYGDLLGYAFEWHPETARLVIARRGDRELGVSLDVVHLQGMTTVVLQFPEEPRYQINRPQPGAVVVEMLADRLTPPPRRRRSRTRWCRAWRSSRSRIRIQLAPGVQAESYILGNPFRLVFDVHPTSSVDVPTLPTGPTDQAPGIRTIVIDPGHGGSETGAIGPSGVQEKELTLQLSRELAPAAQAPRGADPPHPQRGRQRASTTRARRSPTRTRRTCSSRSTSIPRSARAPTARRPTS